MMNTRIKSLVDNKMTFFSGTDTNTLKEEGVDRNHFVSLIVNNEGTYTAAITRKFKATRVIEEHFSYPTFEDNNIVDTKSYEIENEELQWFYLKIVFERAEELLYEELDSRLEEIKKAKAERLRREPKPLYDGYRNIQTSPTLSIPSQVVTNTQVNKGTIVQNPNYKEPELPFKMDESSIVNYGVDKLDKKTVKALVLQILTGSIIIADSSKIDINKWALSMPTLYRKRFGEGTFGLKNFKAWAESYIDYICWYTDDEVLSENGFTDDEIAAICAHDIIEELTKLPENEYIKIYIDILEGYII